MISKNLAMASVYKYYSENKEKYNISEEKIKKLKFNYYKVFGTGSFLILLFFGSYSYTLLYYKSHFAKMSLAASRVSKYPIYAFYSGFSVFV